MTFRYIISYIKYFMFEEDIIMEKILLSLPKHLAARMRAAIPSRQRSKVMAHLLEEEIARREQKLYECALALEKDKALSQEMAEWDITLKDGIDDEPR